MDLQFQVRGEFLYSADSGETWNLNRTGRYVNLTDMSVSPTNDVYFSGLNGIVLKQDK